MRRILTLCVVALLALGSLPRAAWAIEIGNIAVVENDGGDSTTSVTLSLPQASAGFGIKTPNHAVNPGDPVTNRGDYYVQIGASWTDDAAGGILLASVRENGRANSYPDTNTKYSIAPTTPGTAGAYRVMPHWAAIPSWPSEFNVNVAAAYFPFSEGWSCGRATNSVNNEDMTSLVGSADITLGGNFVDVASPTGTYHLSLKKNGGADDVDARADGIVFAGGNKDENNFAAAGPSSDGTHFILETHDDYGGGNENDPIAFAYIPYDTPNVTMGRINGYGGIYNKAGDFTIDRESAGTFRLTIPGENPTTGILLLTPDSTSNSKDNILSYQADGTDFLIEQREIDTGVDPWLAEIGNVPAFSFAFIPFDNPPTAPGVRNFDPTAGIAAANVKVIEKAAGNTGDNLHAEVTEGSGYLTVSRLDKGDNTLAQNGCPIDTSAGVLLASITNDYRDNSATGGTSGRGLANPYTNADGVVVSTKECNGANTGDINVDFAVAYFPFAQGWQGGINNIAGTGNNFISLPGSGDTRRSGVLMVTPYGDDDNLASVSPNSSGTGWNVRLYDNSGGYEGGTDPYACVFLPYGTDGLVAGQIDPQGFVDNRSAEQFVIKREGTGLYRLSIPGQSPATGMLLLNATHASADNPLVYSADGSDFLIQGLDAAGGAAAPQDTEFAFAFIPFDNPPTSPQVRDFDPTRVASANIRVIQNWAQYTGGNPWGGADSIELYTTEATPGFTMPDGNTGDYYMSFEAQRFNLNNGVLLATVRNNGRDNGDGHGTCYGGVEIANDGVAANPWLATSVAGPSGTTGNELNIDLAAVYFPFAGGWSGGHVSSAGTLWAGGNLDASVLTSTGTGRRQIVLPGIDSNTDGMLFAIGGSNSDRVLAAAVLPAGGWDLGIRSNGNGSFYNDDFSFLYVPFGAGNLVGGRVDDDGSLLNAAGDFALYRDSAGVYDLYIPGESPLTGMLMLTVSKLGTGGIPDDNILSYDALSDHFIIHSRDLTGLGLEDTQFVFAFVSFDDPIFLPEPGSVALLGAGLLALARRRRWARV